MTRVKAALALNINTAVLLLLSVLCLSSCTAERSQGTIINLSFTPWVGYYPFHFAIEKRIPEQYGVELRVLETLTVEDFRRTNIKEHVDAFAGSLMEITRVNGLLEEPLDIVSLIDYSNGADVIIARKNIGSLQELKGKVVGFDWRSLGHYFLNLALDHEGLAQDSYTHRQVEQILADDYFAQNAIDAYVSYPPISTRLLENQELHVIFDSSEIPYQIMDVLVMKKGNEVKKQALEEIWYAVTDCIEENPAEYFEFVSMMMDNNPLQAKQELAQIVSVNSTMQRNVSREEVARLAINGCGILGNEESRCLKDLKKMYLYGKPLLN